MAKSQPTRNTKKGLIGTRWGAGGKKGKRSCDEVRGKQRPYHKELCKPRNFMKSNRMLYKVVI